MIERVMPAAVDRGQLRDQIQAKYKDVALDPGKGFHFHTGRRLARMLGYLDSEVDSLPVSTVESFAGTGNPFAMGRLQAGETVLDLGCGAGFDTLIAARQVGAAGSVLAIDMTEAMLDRHVWEQRSSAFTTSRLAEVTPRTCQSRTNPSTSS